MKYGEHQEDLEARVTDDVIPAALLQKPELPPHLEPVREIFWLLNAGRRMTIIQGGVFLHPLEIPECLAVADLMGVDGIYFLRVMRPADALYIETLNTRANGHC